MRDKTKNAEKQLQTEEPHQQEVNVPGDLNQIEDGVMKKMMQFFADEMLPVFGISKKVKALAPTEQVRMELKKGLQDFNLVMEDNSIAHFEFQSTNGGRRDQKISCNYLGQVFALAAKTV